MTGQSPEWADPLAPTGMRAAIAEILTGRNYRIFHEAATRMALLDAYRDLAELAREFPGDDEAWRVAVRERISKRAPEDRRLQYWLIGLTRKTAENLGYRAADLPLLFDQTMRELEASAEAFGTSAREMALLLWSGSATLTIRGARKSRVGKALERYLARAALTIIGLSEEDGGFRLGVRGDREVTRETDAEIRTPRGSVRMEIGLIGRGNPEVVNDKIERLARNDMVLADEVPARSTAHRTPTCQRRRYNRHAVDLWGEC